MINLCHEFLMTIAFFFLNSKESIFLFINSKPIEIIIVKAKELSANIRLYFNSVVLASIIMGNRCKMYILKLCLPKNTKILLLNCILYVTKTKIKTKAIESKL